MTFTILKNETPFKECELIWKDCREYKVRKKKLTIMNLPIKSVDLLSLLRKDIINAYS